MFLVIVVVNSRFLERPQKGRGVGGVVGLTLSMARADRGSRPVYYLPCSDLGQVVNLLLSVAPEGFSGTFNILFCPYFRSYIENFSLLVISSIQRIYLNDAILKAILDFLGSCRGILQDF